jgi:hypothetical protein
MMSGGESGFVDVSELLGNEQLKRCEATFRYKKLHKYISPSTTPETANAPTISSVNVNVNVED